MDTNTWGLFYLCPEISLSRITDKAVRRLIATLDIYFDGKCPLCIRSVEILRKFDWSHRLQFIDLETPEVGALLAVHQEISIDDLRRELHLIAPDQSVHRGFFAFRRIARALPTLWPVLPVLYLPGARATGPIVYRRVAEKRSRPEPCAEETCQRHGHA